MAVQLPDCPFGKSRLESRQKRWEMKKVCWWELKHFVVLYQGKNGAVGVFGQSLISQLGGLREEQRANWLPNECLP
jgi:hypothetical protein